MSQSRLHRPAPDSVPCYARGTTLVRSTTEFVTLQRTKDQKIGGELRYQIKLRNAGAARAAASNPSTPPLPSADGASLEVASPPQRPQQSSDSASESDAGPRDMDSEEEILAHGERESNDSGGVF